MQILVVEDDKRLADALVAILDNAGYQAEAVYDGADGLAYAQSGLYSCMVLDVMLPKMNGFDVATQLRRENNSIPILMLTARSALSDTVGGLDAGADDYMTKPFAPVELLARIRSLTRRQGDVVFETLSFGDVKLDLDSCELSTDTKSIRLSRKEFGIMKILMSNPTRVTSKDTLITEGWGYDSSADDNNVEAYISFLRKKLRVVGSVVHIVSLRKLGYRLEADGEEKA
jgi:two-component system OmpR family response regulator